MNRRCLFVVSAVMSGPLVLACAPGREAVGPLPTMPTTTAPSTGGASVPERTIEPVPTTVPPSTTASPPANEWVALPDFADRPTLLQRVTDPTAPLVVMFHGSRGTIENIQDRSQLHVVGPAAGVAVLWLSGKPLPKRSWNTNNRCCEPASTRRVNDMAYVDAAIVAVRSLGLDPVRVIAAGVSNGAGMAVSVACKRPGVFAAAVSVAGWMPVSCRNTAVSLVAIGGTADDVVGRDKPRQMATAWRRFVVRCPASARKEAIGDARISTWTGCTDGTFVRLVVLDGIDHVWPRFDYYDATADIVSVALGGP